MDRSVDFSGPACILGAFLLLTVPLRWLLAALLAALVHECGHAAAIFLSGGKIRTLRIGAFGACMDVAEMPPWKEFFCTLAGPAASFFLLFFAREIPRTAVCGLVQGIYNLLPVYPLDGGRMLHCVLRKLAGEKTGLRMASMVETAFRWLLALCGIAAAVMLRIGLIPALGLTLFACSRKIPCKQSQYAVQ